MGKTIYIATSMNGFIAQEDARLDRLSEFPNPDCSDLGLADFPDGIDVIVVGRNNPERVLSFGEWPYHKPVWVISRTRDAPPTHQNTRVNATEWVPSITYSNGLPVVALHCRSEILRLVSRTHGNGTTVVVRQQ